MSTRPEASPLPSDKQLIRDESIYGRLPLLPGEREYGPSISRRTCAFSMFPSPGNGDRIQPSRADSAAAILANAGPWQSNAGSNSAVLATAKRATEEDS
ncbi:MAG: hypothetical protein IH881_16490 [Myxococcales bacterium]|nr:hypothetical protein [Myxococcales bacterium]